MKKQTLSKPGTLVRNIFLAAILMLGIIPAVKAQDSNKSNASAVEIKYLGSVENQPIFQVVFENSKQENVHVSITDENGIELYGEKFRDKRFSKKFKFEKLDTDPFKLRFTLTSDNEKSSQVFEVNTKVWTVQDVVVTKL
ncbi:MAG: hypothetical protein ACXWCZ_12860 [Flavisolibacter sp.]